VRSWNVSSVDDYLAAVESGRLPIASSEELTEDQQATEMVMLALRTTDGLDVREYRERFGRDFFSTRKAQLDAAVRDGLLAVSSSRVRPTLQGLAVADRLAADLAF
jgi:oxygen-independent coproporphyrinogen-3 oxidase